MPGRDALPLAAGNCRPVSPDGSGNLLPVPINRCCRSKRNAKKTNQFAIVTIFLDYYILPTCKKFNNYFTVNQLFFQLNELYLFNPNIHLV
jgi:hypothetical protein